MSNRKKALKKKFIIPNIRKDLKDLSAGKLVHTSTKMEHINAYIQARGM